MLLDTDHAIQGTHQREFSQALSEARRQNIQVALSRPCFELWLLLHHVNASEIISINNGQEAAQKLSAVLDGYDKTKLNLGHFPLDCVVKACEQARALDATVSGGMIPSANTTRVYKLIDQILGSVASWQLPPELRQP